MYTSTDHMKSSRTLTKWTYFFYFQVYTWIACLLNHLVSNVAFFNFSVCYRQIHVGPTQSDGYQTSCSNCVPDSLFLLLFFFSQIFKTTFHNFTHAWRIAGKYTCSLAERGDVHYDCHQSVFSSESTCPKLFPEHIPQWWTVSHFTTKQQNHYMRLNCLFLVEKVIVIQLFIPLCSLF